MKNRKMLFAFVVLCLCSLSSAEEIPDSEFWTFTFQNDLFVGEDSGYTNGTGLTFGRAGFKEFDRSNTPGWILALTDNLYVSSADNKERGIAHMFFQRMQTPEDIIEENFIPDDLPYAGLLAWQGTMYAWDEKRADQLSLYLGLVGPLALGEEVQKAIHSAIGADRPQGWQFQLKDEPIIKIEYQRLWNLYKKSSLNYEWDVIGMWGAGVGNLESATRAGFAIRWGKNISTGFGAFSLQADRQVNPLALTNNNDFFFYIGARAGYIANDILVDGNTFTDSPSVPLEHFQDEISAGAVWSYGDFCALVFQVTSNSSRTKFLDSRKEFGAMSFTYRY